MATVGSAIVCDRLRLYGNRSLCDRLRSTIRDRLRSAIVCDRLRSYGNQPLGRCLLLLLRIRSAHLQILGFPIANAY